MAEIDTASDAEIFVFYGAASKACVATFSSLKKAQEWIKQHSLSGLVIKFTMDRPGFDLRLAAGSLPKYLDENDPHARESFVDNSFHWHYFYGVSDDEPGFGDAAERWNRKNA